MQRADVCIICALEKEADAVEQVIGERCQVAFVTHMTADGRFSFRFTTIANSKGEPLTLALLYQSRPGPVSAARDVGALLERFQPCFIGMSGICAGDRQHVRLGDLVVVEHAYHFEEGKVTRDVQGEVLHLPDGITYGPAPQVLQSVQTFEGWRTPVAELKRQTLKTDELPECVITVMASGMAVRSDDPFGALQKQHRKTWTLDMEAAAFYFALRATPFVDGLVVKGVVDYADRSKDNTFHAFAARASAIYLLTFIQEYVTRERLTRSRSHTTPTLFTVPFPRNAFFTGREELLREIHMRFQAGTPTALSQSQAMSGLGGIGKTQVAIEYAYQHRQDYQAVFWVLSDSRESLVSGYVSIARLLNLPEKDEQDQAVIIEAVKNWLQIHGSWLLILDNADEPAVVREFMPSAFGGHILLTTRAQALGKMARRLEVETMNQDVGTLFLLRRTGLIGPDARLTDATPADIAVAGEITRELGGLPLALDQAGAYIEETTCSLRDYQHLYSAHRSTMLNIRGDLVEDHDHPEAVATTWSLSFQKIKQKNPAAADLLQLCAFLHPDAIPEELIAQGATVLDSPLKELANPFAMNNAFKALLAYSLIRRNKGVISLHRLVQIITQEDMELGLQHHWTLCATRVLLHCLPPLQLKDETWQQYQQYFPHIQMCTDSINTLKLEAPEAVSLLYVAGRFLHESARFDDASVSFHRALSVGRKISGPEDPETLIGDILSSLAKLETDWDKYELAEAHYTEALTIERQRPGTDHSSVATILNNLGYLYAFWGKYDQAEDRYKEAIAVREQVLGPEHLELTRTITNLIRLYTDQNKYEDAEPYAQRVLMILNKQHNNESWDLAIAFLMIGQYYLFQGKYEQAEPYLLKARDIWTRLLGHMSFDVATAYHNLGWLHHRKGEYDQAKAHYDEALMIRETMLGREHRDVASILVDLARFSKDRGELASAQQYGQETLMIYEKVLGPEHGDTARARQFLASLID